MEGTVAEVGGGGTLALPENHHLGAREQSGIEGVGSGGALTDRGRDFQGGRIREAHRGIGMS